MQKQKVAKTFDLWIASGKALAMTICWDTSLRINATLSMTRWGEDLRILDCFVLSHSQ